LTPRAFGGASESCSKQFSITFKLISEDVMKNGEGRGEKWEREEKAEGRITIEIVVESSLLLFKHFLIK
jgi:hypothetical protein